jgi:hypothetical protein
VTIEELQAEVEEQRERLDKLEALLVVEPVPEEPSAFEAQHQRFVRRIRSLEEQGVLR